MTAQPKVTKIKLNSEQTKKFLDAFIKEAIEIAAKKQSAASSK